MFIGSLAACGSLLVGCVNRDFAPTEPGQRRWSVSGKIYRTGSTDPLPHAVVKCGGLSTESGPDGSYEIRDVPRGTQTLTAEMAGFDIYSRSIEVTSDTRHNIYLGFQSTDLLGYVSNAVEGPIKGAKVTLLGLVDYTDISGNFRFVNIPQGSGSIHITHSQYIGIDSTLILNESEGQFDFELKRDSVLEIDAFQGTYVDEFLPRNFFFTDRLYLRSNGLDSLGQSQTGIRRYIYLKPDFPQILRYEAVSIIEASLQLCSDGPSPSCSYEVYLVTSFWDLIVTYNRRPEIGELLYSGTIPVSSSGKYLTLLSGDALGKLVSQFRANNYLHGIVIQGGTVNPIGFFSSRASQNRPRMTFRIHY